MARVFESFCQIISYDTRLSIESNITCSDKICQKLMELLTRPTHEMIVGPNHSHVLPGLLWKS